MRKKLLVFNVITSLVVLLLMFIGGVYISSQDNEKYAMSTAKEYTVTFVEQYEAYGVFSVPEDVSYRVTVVDLDGVVIFDNDVYDVEGMENHLDRPEIKYAVYGNPQPQIRHSETLGADMVYYAEVATFEGDAVVIRIALSLSTVQAYFHESLPILIFVLIMIAVLAVVMTIFFGKRSLRPLKLVKSSLEAINRGEYNQIEISHDDQDIDGLLAEINDINKAVMKSFAKVKSEQTKLNYVLDNVADGIVAINKSNHISAINKSAQRIFGVNEMIIGKTIEYLSGDSYFISKMQDEGDQIFELEIEKKIYMCSLNFLENPTKSFNRVLSIRDITARKTAEIMRSEFFANASHELKTPLTVVSGFMEILSMQIKEPKQAEMLEKVASETERMKTLIEDMLALSNLENSSAPDVRDCVISHTCDEVFDTLSIESYKKNVKLSADCNVKIKMSPKHLYELIKNLVENGVKYSNGGDNCFVNVVATESKSFVRITVCDNGIGIDRKHKDRIFERFYRVEKSRSRATGGTGLGLSIVKHIVDLYGGTYTLSSSIGRGTTVTVIIPKSM